MNQQNTKPVENDGNQCETCYGNTQYCPDCNPDHCGAAASWCGCNKRQEFRAAAEWILENYPTLTVKEVQGLLKEHGLEGPENWEDLIEELGEKSAYTSNEVLGFLKY